MAAESRALLVPGYLAGTDLPRARDTRLEVHEDRSLTITTGGATTVVCSAAEAPRLVVLTDGQVPARYQQRALAFKFPVELLGFFVESELRLMIRIGDFDPYPPIGRAQDPAACRSRSGVEGLATALGVPLEGPSASDIEMMESAAGRGAFRGIPELGAYGPSWIWLVPAAGMALAFLAWMCGYALLGLAPACAALALVASPAARLHRARTHFRAAMSAHPNSNADALKPAAPETVGLAEASLQVSQGVLCVADRGVEVRAAIAPLGRVSQIVVWDDLTIIQDRSGATLVSMPTRQWWPRPEDQNALKASATEAGIKVVAYTGASTGSDGGTLDADARGGLVGGHIPFPYQVGSIHPYLAWLTSLCLAMVMIWSLIQVVVAPLDNQSTAHVVWGAPVLVLSVIGLATTWLDSLRVAAWLRRQRKRV